MAFCMACAVVANAQEFHDDVLTYMEYYDDEDGSATAVVFQLYAPPSDGILNVPAYVTAANGTTFRIVGWDARFHIPDEFNGTCKKLVLPETFRELGVNVDGSHKYNVFDYLTEWGDLKTIEISPLNPCFKMEDGMMLSRDGKDLYYISDDVASRPDVVVPEGVEKIYTSQSNYAGYGKYIETRHSITLPSTLKASNLIYWYYPHIIFKCAQAPSHLSPGNYSDYSYGLDSEVLVPVGSRASYRNSPVWSYSNSCGHVREMDMYSEKTVTLDLAFDTPVKVLADGKEVSGSFSVTGVQQVILEIESYGKPGYFHDSTRPGAECLYEEKKGGRWVSTYSFFPTGNTVISAGGRHTYMSGDFGFEPTYDGAKIFFYAKNDSGLESLEIPASLTANGTTYPVTELGEGLFAGQPYESVSLPPTLKRIGAYCFSDGNLVSLTLPEGLEVIGERAFANQKRLRDVAFPSTLREIAGTAFSGCELKTFNIPGAVMSGEDLFTDAGGVMADLITIDESAEPLAANLCAARRIVVNRTWLPEFVYAQELEFNGDNMVVDLNAVCRGGRDLLRKITVRGNDCVFSGKLGSATFSRNNLLDVDFRQKGSVLKEIDVECSSLKVGNGALADIPSLESVKIQCGGGEGLGDSTFENCRSLAAFSAEGLEGEFGAMVFGNCDKLRTLDINPGVTYINSTSLKGCSSLRRVEFSYSATPLFIGTGAFDSCPVEEIALDRRLADPEPTFFRCETLRRLEIGENVTLIPDYAFGDCSNLREIYCATATPPTIGENTFRNVPADICKVYVKGSDGEYREAGGWKEFFPVSGIDGTEVSGIKVASSGGMLTVEGAEGKPIAVYGISGTRHHYTPSASASETISLAPGIYIIIAGAETFKITHK